ESICLEKIFKEKTDRVELLLNIRHFPNPICLSKSEKRMKIFMFLDLMIIILNILNIYLIMTKEKHYTILNFTEEMFTSTNYIILPNLKERIIWSMNQLLKKVFFHEKNLF